MKKKILAIVPVMPQESDIEEIAKTLLFLNKDFQIDFIDPLTITNELPNESYYALWKNELKKQIANYDVFFGFSFGGVILQQCFSLFESSSVLEDIHLQRTSSLIHPSGTISPYSGRWEEEDLIRSSRREKRIVLFSTPTFADKKLQEKLGTVIRLCKDNAVVEALNRLYVDVFYPYERPAINYEAYNPQIASQRLIFGLQRALDTDSSPILKHSTVKHLHLIGEFSNLVNVDNVIAPKTGCLDIVPQAGMRILQDNPSYCENRILKWLNCGE